ncbi:MAG: mechanosensitive ion channel [Deltaproteobacteria bacterium]|nr:mechanosensitive ion channel [Deltaproteobacteria bacterium]
MRMGCPSGFKTLLLTLILLIATTTHGNSQQQTAEGLQISPENLKALIETLETPEKREALIKQLKILAESQKIQAEEQTRERKASNIVETVIMEYGQMTREASRFFHGLFDLARRMPQGAERAMAYLSAEENRAVLYETIVVLGAGIALALLIILLVRRFTSALSKKLLAGKERTGRARIYEAAVTVVIRVSPYGALLVGAIFVLNLLGVQGQLYLFVFLFLLTLLLYESIFTLSRILLNPYDPKIRIVPVTDETSAYLWIWTKRFLNLWVFYYVVSRSLKILGAPPPVYLGINRILVILFPLLATVLLFQIKRMYPLPRVSRAGRTFWSRFLFHAVRLWPLAAGGFVWLIFIFIAAGYREGVSFLLFATLKTLAVLVILWGLLRLIGPLFNRLFSLGREMEARFPGLEAKTNRYVGTLRRIVEGVVAALGTGTILEFWGLHVSWLVTSELGSTILSHLIAIALAVGLVMAIIDINGFVADRLAKPRTDSKGRAVEPGRTKRTLIPLIHWVINVASVFVGAVVVLSQLGVNVTPILAGAGILGLAVGFGAQSLVKDFINGLFILFEGSVAVGDVVVINGTGGLVEGVTLRTVKMRDLAGNVHVIPNGSINMITNMTKEYSRYVFDVGVAYRENVDEVMDVLREIGESMLKDPEFKDDILEPLEILGVDRFDDSAVVIKARIATKPIKQWRIGREFNRRIKKVFDERNIEIPFPHTTVYWGEPKTGRPHPLTIQISGQTGNKAEDPA